MQKVLVVFLFISFLFVNVLESQAQAPEVTDSPTPSPAEQKKIDYTLPYPGILPDHPLYKLKVLRDKITEKLISDPKKKVEFYLLQTDKGIVSADFLVDKKNIELAKTIALKAENNYTEITFLYKASGIKPDKDQYEKLSKAAKKHQELLMGTIKKVNKKDKETFETVLYFSKINLEELERIYKDE